LPSDTRWTWSGNEVGEHAVFPTDVGATATVSKLYVLPNTPFQENGRVIAIEFYAETAGAIDIYVSFSGDPFH
jgi:hypothetical protein